MTDGPSIVLAVPDLADEFVRLRPWRVADVEALVAAWHAPDIVAGSTPPADRTPAAARRWIEGWEDRRLTGRALDLVVADPTDDRVLGEVGLSRFDAARRAALIGWWVARVERGQGIATRAVGTVVDWALDDGRLDAVIAEIGADNAASMRVAQLCGFDVLRAATSDAAAVFVRRRSPS